MPDLTAKRTLVKSPPELWEELSEVDRLAKHLGAFGEITITKLEPEQTVAWEGERASGTVSIEPSGWGTKVTLRAELPEAAPEPEPEPEPDEPDEPEPAVAADPRDEAQHIGQPGGDQRVEPPPEAPAQEPELAAEEEPRRGFWGWLFRRRTEPVATAPMPAEPVAAEPETEPVAAEPAPEPLIAEPEAATEPEPVATEPEPEPVAAQPAPEPLVAESETATEPEPAGPDAEAEPTEPALDPERARVILDEALDALGAAHHRPFSRG